MRMKHCWWRQMKYIKIVNIFIRVCSGTHRVNTLGADKIRHNNDNKEKYTSDAALNVLMTIFTGTYWDVCVVHILDAQTLCRRWIALWCVHGICFCNTMNTSTIVVHAFHWTFRLAYMCCDRKVPVRCHVSIIYSWHLRENWMNPVDLHLHHDEMEERKKEKEKGVDYRRIMNVVDT